MALHEDAAFVIDAVQGVVRQLDPRTLAPVGEPVRYPPGITGGAFDGEGRLWIAVPSEGTVSAITAGAAARRAGGGAAAPAARRARRWCAPRRSPTPSHDLALSTLDDGVAVLDRTTNTLTTVRGDDRSRPPRCRWPGRARCRRAPTAPACR